MPRPRFEDAPTCQFCGALSNLLCDGKLPDGKTCDKRICRQHAHMVAHLRIQRKGGCGSDTRDLCPDCVEAKRSAW